VRNLTVTQLASYRRARELVRELEQLGYMVVVFSPHIVEDIDKDSLTLYLTSEGQRVIRALKQEHEGS
jgi:hypothetical protein